METYRGNILEKEKYQIKSWIETDYKLSDEELEVAKEYIDKYFKENKQANQLLNSKTATAAAANCELKLGTRNTYQGVANNGMKIDMLLNQNGKIISAFPRK